MAKTILYFPEPQSHSYYLFAFSLMLLQVFGYHVPLSGQPLLVKDGLVGSNFKVVPPVEENDFASELHSLQRKSFFSKPGRS